MAAMMQDGSQAKQGLPMPATSESEPKLAHELRNIAANMHVYMQLLERKNLTEGQREKFLHSIQGQIDRLVSVADKVG